MKFKSKIISILAGLIIAINFLAPVNAYAYSAELNIESVQQQKTRWCWAASSQAVSKYLTNSTISQREIVKYLKYTTGDSSTMYPNEGGNANEMIAAVRYATNNIYTRTSLDRALTFDEIKYQISNQHKPIICRFSRVDGGHATVIYGFDTGYDGTEQKVLIMDPMFHLF